MPLLIRIVGTGFESHRGRFGVCITISFNCSRHITFNCRPNCNNSFFINVSQISTYLITHSTGIYRDNVRLHFPVIRMRVLKFLESSTRCWMEKQYHLGFKKTKDWETCVFLIGKILPFPGRVFPICKPDFDVSFSVFIQVYLICNVPHQRYL